MHYDTHDGPLDLSPYVNFTITGTDRQGRRIPARSGSFLYLRGFNYWTKSMWGVLPNGKRKLLYRVVN